MKTKSAGTLSVLPPLVLAFGALLLIAPARACTVFCYSQGSAVLAGRSFDVPDDPGFGLLFVPAAAGTHGWVCGGRFSGPCADGMNDQGLFAAVADVPVPASHTTTSSRRPAGIQTFITGLLGNCASVNEAINWCRKLPTPTLYGQVHQDFLGYYTFDTPGHFLVADRSGDSAVLEWYRGKLKVVRKHGRYQLMTNFLLTDPAAGSYPCPRYLADTGVFDKSAGPGLEMCRQVLETTAQGITRYSLLCDLANGDVHVYLRRDFEQPKTLHLADELKKGRHELDLDQWFSRPKPEPLSPPPIIARPTISATEVFQRALAALGGEKTRAKIHSFHGKGTIDDFNMACLRALPTELFGMRPNRFRTIIDFIPPEGRGLGQYVEGFDGLVGWNTGLDGRCHILRGEEYELRKDDAVFGYGDDPANYQTAECLGKARFNGKLCYDLRLVTQTGHEQFHYYDATNYLLAGTFTHEATQNGLSWMKLTYDDYRSFDGFLMPARIESQIGTGGALFHLDSMEINTVTNIPSPPSAQPLVHLDPQTYEKYVGQYRKSFLFGLIYLGPTLSISHATDKSGDYLVASVRDLRAFSSGQDGDFVPVKDNSFVVDPGATDDTIQLTFGRPRNGKTTRVIVNWNGKTLTGARISDKPAG